MRAGVADLTQVHGIGATLARSSFMITCTRARLRSVTRAPMPWNLPNTLTWTRIAAIPLIVLLFYMPYPWADPAAGLLFAAAGITDSLDGYLARRMGQISRLGAFLDPVADKLIVAVALVLLVSKDPRAADRAHGRASSSAARSPFRRCASGWRRSAQRAQGGGVAAGQVQDHPADHRSVDDALPLAALRPADLPARRGAHGRSLPLRLSSRWWPICAPRGLSLSVRCRHS